MAFRKPSRQSFFSSRVSLFLPGDRYFHETSKRTIGQVSRQVSRWIKDEWNRRYCEKCIVIGSQSHKIVHKIVHKHVEMRETICVWPALQVDSYKARAATMLMSIPSNWWICGLNCAHQESTRIPAENIKWKAQLGTDPPDCLCHCKLYVVRCA